MKKKLLIIILCLSLQLLLISSAVYAQLANEDEAKFGLAQSLNNVKKYEESIPVLKDLYARYPQNEKIAFELAKAYGYSGNLSGALPILNKLERTYAADKEFQFIFATILEANQQFYAARQHYIQILEHEPQNEQMLKKVADISSWIFDYKTAADYYHKLLKTDTENNVLKIQLAYMLYKARDYKQAVDWYEQAKVSPQNQREHCRYLADAYLKIGRYPEALELYRQYLEQYPDDNEVRVDLIRALTDIGDKAAAQKEIDYLLENSRADFSAMSRIAKFLAGRRLFDEAIMIYKEILKLQPKNLTAKLSLARVLSWNRDYQESISVYEQIIESDPKQIIPRREKARVLGWTRRYPESMAEYEKIFTDIGPDEATEREMRAKDTYYRLCYQQAIKNYKQWIELEPDNQEALSDLGQIYSLQRKWSNAHLMYERTLEIVPDHFQVKQAQRKVDIYSDLLELESGFEFYEADSDQRLVDMKYLDLNLRASAALTADSLVYIRNNNFFHSFGDFSSVQRNLIAAGVRFYQLPYWSLASEYVFSSYSDSLDESHNHTLELKLWPKDFLYLIITKSRQDVLYNSQTLLRTLEKDNYQLRAELTTNRRITFGTDYLLSDYSDDNEKEAIGADIRYNFTLEPRRLSGICRYENYGYNQARDYYFSPHSFHFNSLSLEWRHYLNKDELFWGVNNFYYTLRYAINFDTNDEHGHTVFADIHRDWRDNFSTHLEYLRKLYEHKKIYSEERLTGYVKLYF